MAKWLVMLVVVVACGGEGEALQQATAHDAVIDTPQLDICAVCTSNADCASGVCKLYGDGYRKCSTTCTAGEPASQCTAPGHGFCNLMGYCACPRYEPPTDAGVDDAQKDAAVVPIDAP